MSSVSSRFGHAVFFPLIFTIFTQSAQASTLEAGPLLPDAPQATAYLLPISRALDTGDIAGAETLVRARLDDAPDDAIAWEVLGVTLSMRGDVTGADAAYAKAVTLEPKRLSAWIKRGDLADASGHTPEALGHWAAALKIAPGYAPAHERLGIAYADTNDLPRALTHLEAAVAAQDTAKLGAKAELAFVYNRIGRPKDTIALLSPQDDGTARMRLALGNAHAQLGDPKQALETYQKGIDAAPDNIALLKAKGALLVETGDWPNAVVVLSKPAAAEPADAFSNLQYARALLAMGRSVDGIAAAERAATADANADILHQALSVTARAHLMARDFSAAHAATTRLVTQLPDEPASWREHAAIQGATGQYEAAKSIYDEAIARFPQDAELLRGRSIVKVRLNQLASAAQDAALAVKVAPKWLEARFLLGEIQRARGENDKAEGTFRSALTLDPDHWPSLVNIATLRLAEGDAAAASRLAQRAVTLSGNAQPAADILKKVQAQQ